MQACKNQNCQEYKNSNCKRAEFHKNAIEKRLTLIYYGGLRNNETACELFLPVENKKEK